jgi:hypothetical protein
MGAGPLLAKLGGPLAAAGIGGAFDVYNTATDPTLTAEGRHRGYVRASVGAASTLGGVAAGAAVGSLLGPIGMLVGGVLGGFGASYLGKSALDAIWSEDPTHRIGGAESAMSNGAQRLELGKGTIDLNVRVDDQRVTWSAAAVGSQAIALNVGDTNPGSYVAP